MKKQIKNKMVKQNKIMNITKIINKKMFKQINFPII